MPLPESHRAAYAAAFAPPLLDPGQPAPSAVAGPRGKGAAKRYAVYRNNVTVSLIEALAATFPATRRIVGDDFFRAMARTHVRTTPPTSPLLFEYGRDFPSFIASYEHARAMPWLADVANIERGWLDAYHAADATPLEAQALTAIPAGQLPEVALVAHPATRIVRSAFPAVAIFAANRSAAPVGKIDETGAEDALITRPGLEVTVRRLPPGGAVFLARLIDGEQLGAAAAAAFAETPTFDLAASIRGMVDAGVFAGARGGTDGA